MTSLLAVITGCGINPRKYIYDYFEEYKFYLPFNITGNLIADYVSFRTEHSLYDLKNEIINNGDEVFIISDEAIHIVANQEDVNYHFIITNLDENQFLIRNFALHLEIGILMFPLQKIQEFGWGQYNDRIDFLPTITSINELFDEIIYFYNNSSDNRTGLEDIDFEALSFTILGTIYDNDSFVNARFSVNLLENNNMISAQFALIQ